jgi:hypothetical protein
MKPNGSCASDEVPHTPPAPDPLDPIALAFFVILTLCVSYMLLAALETRADEKKRP